MTKGKATIHPADWAPAPPEEERRVLMLSKRVLPVERWRCTGWEFEDVICDIDAVEIAGPSPPRTPFHRRPARWLARHLPARAVQWNALITCAQRKYELAFAEVGFIGELLDLGASRAWRSKCNVAVCYIEELFVPYLRYLKRQVDVLHDFDIIFCGCAHSTEALSERIGKEVRYLPFAVDALRFLPTRPFAERRIDITNLGRRSPVTHEALARYAENSGGFYYFDTTTAPRLAVKEPARHRALIAHLIQNTRFFVANQAYFDRPDKRSTQEEIGFRFFEGAAGGAVVIGEPPRTEEFRTLFGWEDAAIEVPAECPNIGEILAGLSQQPERLEAISRRNVMHSLRLHDWAYRWRDILEAAGLRPTLRLTERIKLLHRLAGDFDGSVPAQTRPVAAALP